MSSPIVSEARLNYFRAQAEKSMDKTVVVQRLTKAVDAVGGYTETWTTVATTVAEVAPLRGSSVEEVVGLQLYAENLWWFEMPWNTDIRIEDRIVMAGLNYQVGYVADPESYEIMQRVIAQRLE